HQPPGLRHQLLPPLPRFLYPSPSLSVSSCLNCLQFSTSLSHPSSANPNASVSCSLYTFYKPLLMPHMDLFPVHKFRPLYLFSPLTLYLFLPLLSLSLPLSPSLSLA